MVDLQLVCLVMDYITWSSMNVNRDTVNDFSFGRFEIFESNIHDTRLINAWTVIVIRATN